MYFSLRKKFEGGKVYFSLRKKFEGGKVYFSLRKKFEGGKVYFSLRKKFEGGKVCFSLRKKFEGGKVYFKCFRRANTKQLDDYMTPVLVDEKRQTVVIHIGSNDITKFNYHDVDVNDLANRILQIGLKCRY